MNYEIKADLAEIEGLAASIEEFGEAHGIAPKIIFGINLALDELITNTISYGYGDDKEHVIGIRLTLLPEEIEVEISDDGIGFNPLKKPEPDINQSAEERPIGGLGIHLVRKMMDQVDYRRQDNRNILTMRKNLISQ
ncbi:MAG TPA: ATP-binding protein [Syntrophomonas sp.]|nr:ATP-binding protein [Syntrophomonas sp.]